MNRGARGRRGNNTPRVQATVRGALNQLKSSMHGHENKLRATAPPPINLTPYNTIIVEELHKAENTTAWPRRISNVVDALRVQTGLTGKLRIKLQRVDVWAIPAPGVAGGENPLFQQTPVVAAKFYSLVAAVDNAPSSASETAYRVGLIELRDIGLSGQRAAVVSYSWPRDQQDMPVGENTANTNTGNILSVVSDAGNDIKVRYHLHWSPIGETNVFE